MLKTPIIHPELLEALGRCGHKGRILIADSNYAYASNLNPHAKVIYLNLCRDMIPADVVLKKVLECINAEAAVMMQWPEDFDNTIAQTYREILGEDVPIELAERYAFYDLAKSCDTQLVIATGESRRFANLLLTVGVVK